MQAGLDVIDKGISEFADGLGMHVQTVKRWCRNGDVDYTRILGGERRIPYRELFRLAGDARPRPCCIVCPDF